MHLLRKLLNLFSPIPLSGWLLGAFAAVLLEYYLGDAISYYLYLPKIPVLFGTLVVLKSPQLIPGVIGYDLLIYILPILLVARLSAPLTNRIAALLEKLPTWAATLLHLAAFYGILHLWAGISDYRVLVVKLILISIILTLSLNIINGWQGEFSCSHPGFMALGAYTSSFLTLRLFSGSHALLSPALGPWLFPLILIAGGAAAALGSLIVAIPSFRTRGDYLAVISLAFMFMVKSAIENMEFLGGPRGLSSQPDYSSLPVIFAWTSLCIWMVHNFTTSIMGKALNAVRDNEAAASSMTVNTRKTKMTAFMFGAFWAGVAGGLFAHVLRYINPGSFGIQNLAEMLAMVYFGGLNSIAGSILGAVSISVLSEALKPLELFKWIIIPLMLILIMIYRPHGLIAFTELNVRKLMRARKRGGADNNPRGTT
ncbi:MAG: branched-chain amino acid transport system permease protein [Candidatus Electronema aureum]|uniref:Branched-chain amino acid transport system permease protein n=1 Tax=Candidatus Electronema aureum TaxID=2005002 RepID=A0A521G1J5_9BACT|nr:MAG: branched-chain amino acid transport system permease protein [Candidatus Electronema aureum]